MNRVIGRDETATVAGVTPDKAHRTTSSTSPGGSFERLNAAAGWSGVTMASRRDAAVLSAEAGATAPDAHAGRGANDMAKGLSESAPRDRGGVTRDQLEARLENTQAESGRYAWLSALIANFDTADINGDGKIGIREAHAFRRACHEQEDRAAAKPPSDAATIVPLVTPRDSATTRMREIKAYGDTTGDGGGTGLSLTT